MFEGFQNPLAKATEFFDETDPKLDQVRKSVIKDLDKLKQNKNLSDLVANMRASALAGFEKDLKEIDTTKKQRLEALALFDQRWETLMGPEQVKAIMSSPEKVALDNFIADLENLPLLKEMMEAAEPKPKWQAWFDGIPAKFKKMVVGVLGLLGAGRETDPKKQGMLDRLHTYLKGDTGKKDGNKETTVATTDTNTEIQKEIPAEHIAAIKPLEDAGITLNKAKVAQDYDHLKQQDMTHEQIVALVTKAVSPEGNLRRIYEDFKKVLGNNIADLRFRLIDVYILDKQVQGNYDKVSAAIAGCDKQNLTGMRAVLGNTRKLPTNPNALDKYIA